MTKAVSSKKILKRLCANWKLLRSIRLRTWKAFQKHTPDLLYDRAEKYQTIFTRKVEKQTHANFELVRMKDQSFLHFVISPSHHFRCAVLDVPCPTFTYSRTNAFYTFFTKLNYKIAFHFCSRHERCWLTFMACLNFWRRFLLFFALFVRIFFFL